MNRQDMQRAEAIAEQSKKDVDRFEAFLIGYVKGANDMADDVDLKTEEQFKERVKEAYRQEYPEAML